ncbi:MAG: pantetheine-phosphate adenylyltransferase [Dehalococcoidia bacterium]
MTTAVYPGRFDPVTNGHLDIVHRAVALFERVVVAVFDLAVDNTLFTTEERVAMFRQAVVAMPSVEVAAFSGLVVELAHQQGAQVLVRGIRAVTDFEAEFSMALMNYKMAPSIESVYLMTRPEYLFISGSRIREVASLGYDVSGLVPDHVVEALRHKLGQGR